MQYCNETERKERQILFSTEMVKATLEQRKTQTRRLSGLDEINVNPGQWFLYEGDCHVDEKGRISQKFHNRKYSTNVTCPYGQPGDLLWVRETWVHVVPSYIKIGTRFVYKTDYDDRFGKVKWKPSIHMPKEACRLWLNSTAIRFERLHDITPIDAIAEGIEEQQGNYSKTGLCNGHRAWRNYLKPNHWFINDPVKSFKSLWQSLHGKDSWEANPWVCVIGFDQAEKGGEHGKG